MPGKIKSKAQQRFIGAVASGSVRAPGLSPAKAKEMLHAEGSMKNLPERTKGRRFKIGDDIKRKRK